MSFLKPLKLLSKNWQKGQDAEGFAVRDINAFPVKELSKHTAKYASANHAQADKHWRKAWAKNGF